MNKFKMGSMKRGAALMLLGLVMPYSSHALTASGAITASQKVAAKSLTVSGTNVSFDDIIAGDATPQTKEATFTLVGTPKMAVTGTDVAISNYKNSGSATDPWLSTGAVTSAALSSLDASGNGTYSFNLTTTPSSLTTAGDYTADVTLTVTF